MNHLALFTAFNDYLFYQNPKNSIITLLCSTFILFVLTLICKLVFNNKIIDDMLFIVNCMFSTGLIYYIILHNGNNYYLQCIVIPLIIIVYMIYLKTIFDILDKPFSRIRNLNIKTKIVRILKCIKKKNDYYIH